MSLFLSWSDVIRLSGDIMAEVHGSATAIRGANGQKVDAVFIRKSTREQDEAGQIGNVESMLKELSVSVPPDHWFVGTVSRRKVNANADFLRLMDLVKKGRVGTVYVESQDRWGTTDRPELFSLLGTLRDHGTKLFDLRSRRDLTEKDLATELLAFVGSIKSEKELQDIAYRSLRTRVSNFLASGSWPTGTHPYGFGKACYEPDGKTVKWIWHPVNRRVGQVFHAGPNGVTPGPANVRIPRKDKRDIVKLVPNANPDYVRAVKLIFDLYTQVGLSRRQITVRLNAEGLLFNGGPFAHTNVTDILRNPAYVGDTVFGKVQTGELCTFDAKGLIVEVREMPVKRNRDLSQCLVMRKTHEALEDEKAWTSAKEKLLAELQRTSYAPRNPAYYLKQIFVCGHCGRSMVPRTEISPKDGRRIVVYICSTYLRGRQNGQSVPCGYQRITHDIGESLLLARIKELNPPFDGAASLSARQNLQSQIARLGGEDDEGRERWWTWLCGGVDALLTYLRDDCGLSGPALRTIECAAKEFYRLGGKLTYRYRGALPMAVAEFRNRVIEAENLVVSKAKCRIAEFQQEHRAITLNWAKATDDMQVVLKQEIKRLEDAIRDLEPHTLPLSERFQRLYSMDLARDAERKRLREEWRSIGNREKGETLRRIFRSVTLYWDRTFHPGRQNSNRPRKTSRPGRYSYTLRLDRTEWHLASTDSVKSW